MKSPTFPGMAGLKSIILVFGLNINWFGPGPALVTVPIVLLAVAPVVLAKPELVIEITSPTLNPCDNASVDLDIEILS